MSESNNLYVGIPLYDGLTLMDFVGASEVFAMTNGFKVEWLGATMDTITTSENLHVVPNRTFDEAPEKIDILFIPGGYYPGVEAAMFSPVYQGFLKKAIPNATWVGSVCTGAFVLAAAGGLTDCTATTYWSQLPNLSLLNEKYKITVAAGYPRFVIDEKRKRFSGGGISSSLDLALELLKRIKGKDIAEQTQLNIQYAPAPPVHAGDPSQAPAAITEQVLINEADFVGGMYNAVKKLIGS